MMNIFDVTFLFTNNPLDETIAIFLDQLFADNRFCEGLSQKQINKIVKIPLRDNHVLLNGKLHNQIDGVAMSSSLGQIFATIFHSYHEELLDKCSEQFKPVFL